MTPFEFVTVAPVEVSKLLNTFQSDVDLNIEQVVYQINEKGDIKDTRLVQGPNLRQRYATIECVLVDFNRIESILKSFDGTVISSILSKLGFEREPDQNKMMISSDLNTVVGSTFVNIQMQDDPAQVDDANAAKNELSLDISFRFIKKVTMKPEQLEDGITKMFALFAIFRAGTLFNLINEYLFGRKLEKSF